MKKPTKNGYDVVVLTSNTCGSDSSIDFIPTKRKGKKAAAGSGVEQVAHTMQFAINGTSINKTVSFTFKDPSNVTAAEIAEQINAQCNGVHAEVKVEKPKRRAKVACAQCGRKPSKRDSNCCWITCQCGTHICSRCGSKNIYKFLDNVVRPSELLDAGSYLSIPAQ